ncbi:MAG: hypothetical protein EPN41_12750 [Candidimonas sp.]|nr:MAG: hypothetical protein EPN41_12750 [Candidimonas sp.]
MPSDYVGHGMRVAIGNGMRIAVLVKQIPVIDALRLDCAGRLIRAGLPLEMNPFCRRAVTLGISLARESVGECTVFTMAPPSGEAVLREAIAVGADCGILLTDAAFAGSDTLATSKALAAALRKYGPFDLVICGRNSVDADTGQIGPQVAQWLDMPFVSSAREVRVERGMLFAKSERDDGWMLVKAPLPLVLSAAERSCQPARADEAARRAVDARRIHRCSARELGAGPWGQDASPTRVDGVVQSGGRRAGRILEGDLAAQIAEAVDFLVARDALFHRPGAPARMPRPSLPRHRGEPKVAVVLDPRRGCQARDLAAAATDLAARLGSGAVALVPRVVPDWHITSWGLDALVVFAGASSEESMAHAVTCWARQSAPHVILAPSSLWGREVAARAAVSLGVGLVGDAIELEVGPERQIIALKPAAGDQMLARIVSDSRPQMVTLRSSPAPTLACQARKPSITVMNFAKRTRVQCLERAYDDDADVLLSADAVIGVGMGVVGGDYRRLAPLIEALDASLACSRRVADKGWLPRSRQVGLTGHHIAPALYVAVGLRGGLNHSIGIRRAGCVLAINSDRQAPIFADADIGIHGQWERVVPMLADRISAVREAMHVDMADRQVSSVASVGGCNRELNLEGREK